MHITFSIKHNKKYEMPTSLFCIVLYFVSHTNTIIVRILKVKKLLCYAISSYFFICKETFSRYIIRKSGHPCNVLYPDQVITN